MERRNFIKTFGIGTTATLISPQDLFARINNSTEYQHNINDLSGSSVDPLVPFKFYSDRKEYMLEQLIKMKNEYGLRRFLLTAPNEEVRFGGFPKLSVYSEIGNMVLEVKNALAKHDIEIGWWCAPTLRMGAGAPFQYITGIDGSVSNTTPCPLDSAFQNTFSDYIQTVVRIARPSIIQFEDDYELSWQPPVSFGCFCPLHLNAFSKIVGKNYTREELMAIFKTVTPESIKLRTAWAILSKESLVQLAKSVRNKIDTVAPETRISLCQSGMADLDGDFTKDLTQALAGKTRPLTRLYGTNYSSFEDISLPQTVFHALFSKQHLPDFFECMHESDTYPHTRFFMSAGKLKSLMTVAFSYGLDNVLIYPTQYLDNPVEEKGYVEVFRDEHLRFDTIKKEIKKCQLDGCEVIYKPEGHTVIPYTKGAPGSPFNDWVRVLGRFGIPYTSKNGNVKLVSGDIASTLHDEEINDLLKGRLLLDGYAANILYERGWGISLGVDIKPREKLNFCYESIRDPEKIKNIEGRLMYNLAFAPAGNERSAFYEMSPINEDVEIVTDFLDENENPVIPGLIRFRNKQGGKVAIIAYDLRGNSSSSIFNYKKKELIKQTIEWLGDTSLPIFVKNNPNVFCIANKSLSGKYMIATIISLCADPFNQLMLDISPEFRNSKIEILQSSGKWELVKTERNNNEIIIKNSFLYLSPIVLKFNV